MTNILITGVGGQGSLLASRILGALLGNAGLEVKVSEVHGMSQRGGSVVTYVRGGERVDAPLIPKGEVDLLIAFEQIEALRWLSHLRPGGKVAMSTQKILPMPVISGAAAYPADVEDTVTRRFPGSRIVDALELARTCGGEKSANVVMLGAASTLLPYGADAWKAALTACIKPKFLEMNLLAFEKGRDT